jgi:hypothetical protein
MEITCCIFKHVIQKMGIAITITLGYFNFYGSQRHFLCFYLPLTSSLNHATLLFGLPIGHLSFNFAYIVAFCIQWPVVLLNYFNYDFLLNSVSFSLQPAFCLSSHHVYHYAYCLLGEYWVYEY